MKRNLMICLAMGLLAAPVLAQEAKKAEKPEKAEKAGAKKGEGDMAAMMAAWKKYATPGEGHAVMKPIAGSWTAAVKMWMPGGAPPQESTATSEGKWIMGDRYIQEDVKGTFNGMPFEGRGVMGYDNLKKKYVGVWIDNMGTGMMTSEGSYDAAKKTFAFTSEHPDPMTGKNVKSRETLRIESDAKMVREMWEKAPGGKEFKAMEITYTRKGVASAK